MALIRVIQSSITSATAISVWVGVCSSGGAGQCVFTFDFDLHSSLLEGVHLADPGGRQTVADWINIAGRGVCF